MPEGNQFKWTFEPQTGMAQGANNALVQNFSSQGLYQSLIRESIQNSLDAVIDKSKPVRVKVDIGKMNTSDFEGFDELKEHIKGCINTFKSDENAIDLYEPMLLHFNEDCKEMGFIRVTDSNTSGMEYIKDNTSCPFYAFARSCGVSSKENNTAGGSFGFGKAAYFNMSPISTIIISTHTLDHRYFFEGISLLCTHAYKGRTLTSVGYYDNNDGEPVYDINDIPSSFRCSEPGTSISIVGFTNQEICNIDAKSLMIQATLRNFWMAIWEEHLEVTIEDQLICKNNLDNVMVAYFHEEVDKKTYKEDRYNPRPYFDAVRFADTSSRYIKKRESIDSLGYVDFYINKNKYVDDKLIFMRKPLMTVYLQLYQFYYHYNGVVVCRSDEGNKILRNLENAAHNEWKAKNWRRRDMICDEGKKAIESLYGFINRSIKQVFSATDKSTINIMGLENYLFIPEEIMNSNETFPKPPNEAPSGHQTECTFKNAATSPTNVSLELQKENNQNPQSGHVIIQQKGEIHPEKESPTYVGTGHNQQSSKQKGGQPIGGHHFEPANVNHNGNITFLYAIPVTYKVIAQIEKGNVYHSIIFHSDIDAKDGEIELTIGGEQNTETLKIIETSAGICKQNRITNLNVNTGKNIVKVRFEDKMKHAVIMKVYERK